MLTIEALNQKINLPILENESMAKYSTYRIGGPARFFVVVRNKQELLRALTVAKELELKYFVLGGGSNILVADKGFDGLVINTQDGEYQFENNEVIAFAGVNLSVMIRDAVKKGLGGLEFAGNIPGMVGGGVRGNCGAYGQGVGDFVAQVEVIVMDADLPYLKELTQSECEFAYRESIFKRHPELIIAEVKFVLKLDGLAEEKLKAISAEWQRRAEKQPLECPSAGCSFKNIIYDDTSMSKYSAWSVQGKLAAGKFIEEADLKGMKIGGAMVSDKHGNFIINTGKATADDVVQLISLVKTRVRNEFGINLEEEIQYVGF